VLGVPGVLDVFDLLLLPHADATARTANRMRTIANRDIIELLSVGRVSACVGFFSLARNCGQAKAYPSRDRAGGAPNLQLASAVRVPE
jgi:hypothetical protein